MRDVDDSKRSGIRTSTGWWRPHPQCLPAHSTAALETSGTQKAPGGGGGGAGELTWLPAAAREGKAEHRSNSWAGGRAEISLGGYPDDELVCKQANDHLKTI